MMACLTCTTSRSITPSVRQLTGTYTIHTMGPGKACMIYDALEVGANGLRTIASSIGGVYNNRMTDDVDTDG